MEMGRLSLLGVVGILAALAASSVGSAAPKTNCANEASGWTKVTTAEATDRIWPALLDTSPWNGDKDAFEEVVESADKNGDGDVCLQVMWGEALNPNSHWYLVGIEILGSPTEQFFVHDNRANGSG
jgi:hypothetical protein